MNPVCRLKLCTRSIIRFLSSVHFHASVKPTGSKLCSLNQPPCLGNESSLLSHIMYQTYTSLRKFCSLLRLCESFRFITVLRDSTTGPCKWIQSVGSLYIPNLYFAADGLFTSSPLWKPQVHYCTHRHKHRSLKWTQSVKLTLCSRSIFRFGWCVHFIASVKPIGSLLCSETKPTAFEN
jgi:hypothetical protein